MPACVHQASSQVETFGESSQSIQLRVFRGLLGGHASSQLQPASQPNRSQPPKSWVPQIPKSTSHFNNSQVLTTCNNHLPLSTHDNFRLAAERFALDPDVDIHPWTFSPLDLGPWTAFITTTPSWNLLSLSLFSLGQQDLRQWERSLSSQAHTSHPLHFQTL